MTTSAYEEETWGILTMRRPNSYMVFYCCLPKWERNISEQVWGLWIAVVVKLAFQDQVYGQPDNIYRDIKFSIMLCMGLAML